MFKILTFDKLNSTNKYALDNIDSFDVNTIVRAKTQDAGRGRFDRKWISDKDNNCYMSFVLKPDIKFQKHFPNLTQYLSVVLCDLLEEYGIQPNIKWPNDVQINGKKIAGILSELSFGSAQFNGIVLGIGVNLNLTNEDIAGIDIPATSLNLEINNVVDSDKFINQLCEKFYLGYEDFLVNGFERIRASYISKCNFIGKEISIKNLEPVLAGIAINISADGSLEVLSKNGEIKKIISGDVIV